MPQNNVLSISQNDSLDNQYSHSDDIGTQHDYIVVPTFPDNASEQLVQEIFPECVQSVGNSRNENERGQTFKRLSTDFEAKINDYSKTFLQSLGYPTMDRLRSAIKNGQKKAVELRNKVEDLQNQLSKTMEYHGPEKKIMGFFYLGLYVTVIMSLAFAYSARIQDVNFSSVNIPWMAKFAFGLLAAAFQGVLFNYLIYRPTKSIKIKGKSLGTILIGSLFVVGFLCFSLWIYSTVIESHNYSIISVSKKQFHILEDDLPMDVETSPQIQTIKGKIRKYQIDQITAAKNSSLGLFFMEILFSTAFYTVVISMFRRNPDQARLEKLCCIYEKKLSEEQQNVLSYQQILDACQTFKEKTMEHFKTRFYSIVPLYQKLTVPTATVTKKVKFFKELNALLVLFLFTSLLLPKLSQAQNITIIQQIAGKDRRSVRVEREQYIIPRLKQIDDQDSVTFITDYDRKPSIPLIASTRRARLSIMDTIETAPSRKPHRFQGKAAELPQLLESVRGQMIDELWIFPSGPAFSNLHGLLSNPNWNLRAKGLPGVKVFFIENQRRSVTDTYFINDFIAWKMHDQGVKALFFNPHDRNPYPLTGKRPTLSMPKIQRQPKPIIAFSQLALIGSWEHGDIDMYLCLPDGQVVYHKRRQAQYRDMTVILSKDFRSASQGGAVGVKHGFETIDAFRGDLKDLTLWINNYSSRPHTTAVKGQIKIRLDDRPPVIVPFRITAQSNGRDFSQRENSHAWRLIDLNTAVNQSQIAQQ